ncbi:MAG: pseudouridine synthase [Deltaproteobacteria bacterium]|nr:pseudouridine synthase [Deltaproteobacteria bacterium]
MRLQKFLSSAGVCSRRKGEEFIVAGKVSVNGKIITELGTKIDPARDQVDVDGQVIKPTDEFIYIALNKPGDYVTSCSHPGEKIVVDLVDISERIYPVGRLDKDSTGLLLLTNDGRIHHRLSHPSFDHEKEYDVSVARPISDGALQKMRAGLPLMGTRTRPARVARISARRFRIVLQEGRNRQIRRMVRKVGNKVTRLQRIRVAGIKLGKLASGKWRHLSQSEKESLLP